MVKAVDHLTERYSEANIRHNTQTVDKTRIFIALMAGCACGIMGYESWWGIVYYVLSSLLASTLILAHAGFEQSHKYFRSISDVVVSGLFGGAYFGVSDPPLLPPPPCEAHLSRVDAVAVAIAVVHRTGSHLCCRGRTFVAATPHTRTVLIDRVFANANRLIYNGVHVY